MIFTKQDSSIYCFAACLLEFKMLGQLEAHVLAPKVVIEYLLFSGIFVFPIDAN